jgi:hypothetical protein
MSRQHPRYRPAFEHLEDRSLPSLFHGFHLPHIKLPVVHVKIHRRPAKHPAVHANPAPATPAGPAIDGGSYTLTAPKPAAPTASALDLGNLAAGALSGLTRNALLQVIRAEHPDGTLFDGRDNWGHTSRVVTGYKPVFQGIASHLEPIYGDRNDGLWTHSTVSLGDPNHFELQVQNLRVDSRGKLTFQVSVSAELRFATDALLYQSGYQLGAVDGAGRVRVNLTVNMEATAALQGDVMAPTASFDVRAVGAQAGFDNLVFDRIGYLGGVSADLLGGAVKRILDQWKPGLIRDQLGKAQQSVVQALHTQQSVPVGKLLADFYNAQEAEYAKNFHESLY